MAVAAGATSSKSRCEEKNVSASVPEPGRPARPIQLRHEIRNWLSRVPKSGPWRPAWWPYFWTAPGVAALGARGGHGGRREPVGRRI